VVARDPGDHLLDQYGLAHSGSAEEADLAAEHVRRQQVDDLDPVWNISVCARGCRRPAPCGGSPALGDVERLALLEVERSPRVLKTWPLVASPTGT
jgi:hypothetical protein